MARRARLPAGCWGHPATAASQLTSWRPGWATPGRNSQGFLPPERQMPHRVELAGLETGQRGSTQGCSAAQREAQRLQVGKGQEHRETVSDRLCRRVILRSPAVPSTLCPPAWGWSFPTAVLALSGRPTGGLGLQGPRWPAQSHGCSTHCPLPTSAEPAMGGGAVTPPPMGFSVIVGGRGPQGHQAGSPRVVSTGSCTQHMGCSDE